MAPPPDIELNPLQNFKGKAESLTHGSSHSMREPEYLDDQPPPRFQRFLDSFKRDTDHSFFPSDHLSQVNSHSGQRQYGRNYYDLRLAAFESANTGLARKLKGRHLQMIAIGGSIVQWLTVLPLEIIAASLTISYWGDALPKAGFVGMFLFVILVINLFGVKGYGEAEFTFSIVKVIAVIGFILLGVVLNCGGTPDRGYIGGEFWHEPGAFNNGFKGLCSVFVTAAFAFTGTELVGLAAAETANPRKSLPTAIKQVFWRISLFYVVALALVGLLVPYTDPRLLGGDSRADARASPFVIAIEEAGIEVLPSVMNAVILVAVLSVGNSAVFGSSRTLAALANLQQAPSILGYVDKRGRPLVAILVAALLGLLAFLADLREQASVFDWLLAISGLSTVFTWTSICFCHIRFRHAWATRGRHLNEMAYNSQVGVVGSYVGFILNILVLIAQFWVGAFPIGWQEMAATEVAENFFLKFMGVPIVLLFYVLHKLYYRTSFVRIRDMDIDTGRRDFNLSILIAHEKEEKASWPTWKRFYKFMC
ncbi:general amino-acid permease GAP1 [Metarhizium album ARSEF 1941]|uniref:General amino-acid permease GAP1 n=1 Tax=Metarhizium album (strain ARSEF 1941) TaxID=1081103 RepID=A0A0B2X3Q4_METAS|nr:general amino-acid permease GAP1 [Metarhizium album ARSEF 1941]KHN99940.1 general amino-acid permease GAP1 [Metarhizium album ARSEF 1941]